MEIKVQLYVSIPAVPESDPPVSSGLGAKSGCDEEDKYKAATLH
jgi:hypothetical protein